MLMLAGLLLFVGCMEDVSDARAGLTNDCSDCIDDTGGAAPVAEDGEASTNEDNDITIILEASDTGGES